MPMSAKGFKCIMSWDCLNSPMNCPLLLQRFREVNLLKIKRVDENTGYSEIMPFHPIPTPHLFSASRGQNPMDGGQGARKSTDKKGKGGESRAVPPRLLLGKGPVLLQAG